MDFSAFHLDRDPGDADLNFLDGRIYEYNCRATGACDGNLFALTLRNEQGEIIAGLHGWTWARACEIRTLWVDETLRGQGIGTALLQAAEEEARAQGCQVILLDSHSFQAPVFYQKHGYRVLFCLEDFPPGFQTFYLEKRLV